MTICKANAEDVELLEKLDCHISGENLKKSIANGRILTAKKEGQLIGWLRWNLFWDNTPFMNLLFVLEPDRGTGAGKALILAWERQMWDFGFEIVMTSTQSNEYAQHFYEKLGYRAVGGFALPGDPYELILAKTLR